MPVMLPFADRREAGRALAEQLVHLRGARLVVLGLPRGGVPVAAEVASALGAPLDVIAVRKLGAPTQPELAMGAVGEDGVRVLNAALIDRLGVTATELERVEARERAVLDGRLERVRAIRVRQPLEGSTALVVDDGVATGSTARAACLVARAHGAARVVVATPVGPADSLRELAQVADEVACLMTPEPFNAVGDWYRDFTATTDDEVVELLRAAHARQR